MIDGQKEIENLIRQEKQEETCHETSKKIAQGHGSTEANSLRGLAYNTRCGGQRYLAALPRHKAGLQR